MASWPVACIKTRRLIDPTDFLGLGRNKGDVLHSGLIIQRNKGIRDRQIILAGKIKIPLIMGGTAKDRASAVIHQYEIGDPDRQSHV